MSLQGPTRTVRRIISSVLQYRYTRCCSRNKSAQIQQQNVLASLAMHAASASRMSSLSIRAHAKLLARQVASVDLPVPG